MSPDISEDLRKSIERALGRPDRLKVFGLLRKHFQNFRNELRQFEVRRPKAGAPSENPAEAPIEPDADGPPPASSPDMRTDQAPAPETEPSGRRERGMKKRKASLYTGGTIQDLQQAMRLNVIFSPPLAMNKESRHRDRDKNS